MDSLYIKKIEIINKEKQDMTVFPLNMLICQELESIEFTTPTTIILGGNGIGKSTLIEALSVNLGFNHEGGTKNTIFSKDDAGSILAPFTRVIRTARTFKAGFFFKAESLYKWKTIFRDYYGVYEEGYQDYHTISHGEGSLEIIKKYFRKDGLYILDEPEVALSPESQFALLNLMYELETEKNCQFIIATHSPIIAGYELATIYEIDDNNVAKKAYEDTMLYSLYYRYLLDAEYRKSILK